MPMTGTSRQWPVSPLPRALRVDVEGVERVAGGDEQAVAFLAAEGEVGAALGQPDAHHQLTFRREHPPPVELRRPDAPADPEIAIDIAAHAVGIAALAVD